MGYDSMLMKECIKYAKQKHFDGIELYTGSWMELPLIFIWRWDFRIEVEWSMSTMEM